MSVSDLNSAYWDRALEPMWHGRRAGFWRSYCDELYRRLMLEWLGDSRYERVLKTDLFDEAMGLGLVKTLGAQCDSVHGLDLSPAVVSQAARGNPQGQFLAADVRRLPYRSGTFCLVFSNSTLDHFPHHADIVEAVAELKRLLRPGGRLLVTFDNLSSPWIAVRNALPFALLHRIGVVPYFVGASVTASGLKALLEEAGFNIERTGTLMHVPRAAAVPLCSFLERWLPGVARPWLNAMLACEGLRRWPTRLWTGHYVAALASLPVVSSPPGASSLSMPRCTSSGSRNAT